MSFGFQRQTDLALAALRVLSTHGSLSGADLADEVGTTISYLPQVMSPLVREGWVVSHRGPGGGYRITSEAHAASIRDVIDVTEGSIVTGRCVMRDEPCPGARECPIHTVWAQARTLLVDGLDSIPAVVPGGGQK
jgi:Rrf2 family iron-sulfur cluster assembly transcriptional regulator